MKDSEARAIVGSLRAAFPQANVPRETVELWVTQVAKLQSTEAAVKAVQELIESENWFPSFARFREFYGIAANRIASRRESEQRKLAEERGLTQGKRPPLPAEIQALIARLTTGMDLDKQLSPAEDEGDCADCGKHGPVFTVGSRVFCREHALSRLRVRAA